MKAPRCDNMECKGRVEKTVIWPGRLPLKVCASCAEQLKAGGESQNLPVAVVDLEDEEEGMPG